MSTVKDLYEARVKPLMPRDKLQLARLILDDLSQTSVVEQSDEWSDDDLADVVSYAARCAAASDESIDPRSESSHEPR